MNQLLSIPRNTFVHYDYLIDLLFKVFPVNGWIIVAAVDEASPVSQCWSSKEWIEIDQIVNATLFTIEEGVKIEDMRSSKAEIQAQYTDRDVRIAEVTVTISLGEVIN